MILSTYYRQNHYHPIYAMRSTFGVLIQVPFFIAAYSYLSTLESLQNFRFFLIENLGAPDALLNFCGTPVNVLPICMTIINCVAGSIYTKGLPAKEKIQLYVMAGVFLVLLYHSPAGLVLYWTLNNIFSLIKNILQKIKHSKKIVFYSLCFFSILLSIYVLFFHSGYLPKRLFISSASLSIFLFPFFSKKYFSYKQKIKAIIKERDTVFYEDKAFIFSSIILFLLAGLVIPSALISSSVQEFSYIDPYKSPFPFIIHTITQSAGMFLFLPMCLYCLFTRQIKILFTAFTSILAAAALADTFIFPGKYGYLSLTLIFSDPGNFLSNIKGIIFNILVIICVIVIFSYILLYRNKVIVYSIQIVLLMSLFGFSVFNVINIYTKFLDFSSRETKNQPFETISPVYSFTQTGKNVLVIMLDRAISSYIPYIFQEKPQLFESFSGFTWYPNCVSFGAHTIFGAPPLFGGYEYTPLEMQKMPDSLVKKHNQSLLVLPRIFLEEGYSVTTTDPSWANFSLKPDLRIFEEYPEIKADNLISKYSAQWLKQHPELPLLSIPGLLKNNLIRFSLFKFSPLFLRNFLYDDGNWLVTRNIKKEGYVTQLALDNYLALDFLPNITTINDNGKNSFISLVNELTHHPFFLQRPDYVLSALPYTPPPPVNDVNDAHYDAHYHVNMAAFLLLGKWFDYLKENKVYDNTRIIIVSDHGENLSIDIPDNIILPNGKFVSTYNPLLMVKDFTAEGRLATDNSFSSNADVPVTATQGIINNPVNPFTGKRLMKNKSSGLTITTSSAWAPDKQEKTKFNIKGNEWLHVHDNIFDPQNWKFIQEPLKAEK
jgi:hypothetical protein